MFLIHKNFQGEEIMLQKIADMMGVSPEVVIITTVILVILFIFFYVKMTIDEKKGVNSQEKADVRKIVTNLIPDGQEYTAVYAHSKEVYGSARMRREVYHYYAAGFHPARTDHLWVIPIGVEGGKIVYTKPLRASAEILSYVGGNERRLELHFPGTKDKYILSVEGSNTKNGKECQVNIQQKEEAETFYTFAAGFQERVNAALGVDKKGRPVNK